MEHLAIHQLHVLMQKMVWVVAPGWKETLKVALSMYGQPGYEAAYRKVMLIPL
jgi:hypothetical protein